MNGPAKPKTPATYKVDDQEFLLEYYKRALWNRIVPRIPASIAPNTITIVGQIAALLALVFAYLGVMGTPFFYLVSAFLLLAYLTADNIDGPHARRTGQSSPLGEFLDHGLDGVASGAVLLTTALVLRADPIPLVLLCILGAIGFVMVFWEQFRTGLLVIPRFSSTEGVTFLMVLLLVLFFGQDPSWLAFSVAEFNVATFIIILVLVGYAGAMAPPIIRANRAGTKPWELLPIALIAGSFATFPALGGQAVIPAIAVGIFGADVVCRMIVLRHRGESGPLLSPLHYLVPILAIGAAAAPDAWTVTGWSTLALIVIATLYARTMHRGIVEMISRHEAKPEVHALS